MSRESCEIGVEAARMEKHAAWKWGEAIVIEAGWTPGQAVAGTGRGHVGESAVNSLSFYRERVAREAGLETADLPSEEVLRHRAIAFHHARDYRDEIAISTAYEAAVAVTSEQWDGTVAELLEEARNEKGRITVDGVRAVLERPPATITRPRDAVQHFQRAGQHLRDGARDILSRDEVPPENEIAIAIEALRQVVQVATILIHRLEGQTDIDKELGELLSDVA